MKLSPDYVAAVKALGPKPSTCPKCEVERVCFAFSDIDDRPHFACPDCEAACWYCVDEVAPGGIWTGPLRLACDPCWAWIPESQRTAIAVFGMLGVCGTGLDATLRGSPLIALASLDGAAWAGDRGNLLRLDAPPEALPAMARLILRNPGVEPRRVEKWLAQFVSAPGYRDLEVASDVCPVQSVALVTALYPAASWSWIDRLSPVLAFVESKPVAVVMPKKPEEVRVAA